MTAKDAIEALEYMRAFVRCSYKNKNHSETINRDLTEYIQDIEIAYRQALEAKDDVCLSKTAQNDTQTDLSVENEKQGGDMPDEINLENDFDYNNLLEAIDKAWHGYGNAKKSVIHLMTKAFIADKQGAVELDYLRDGISNVISETHDIDVTDDHYANNIARFLIDAGYIKGSTPEPQEKKV